MRRLLPLLLTALLAGCVDFVEPDSLGLMKAANVQFTVSAGDAAFCGATPTGREATICLQAFVSPGVDRYGRPRRMLVDTLYALGTPLLPVGEGAQREYRGAWHVPLPQLGDSMIVLRLPIIEGVPIDPPVFHWYGFGRTGPETLEVRRDGTLQIDVMTPRGIPFPVPHSPQWQFDFPAPSATFTMRGTGFPWGTYRLPDALLAELQTSVIPARLSLLQYYFAPARPDLVLYATFNQHLSWRIRRVP